MLKWYRDKGYAIKAATSKQLKYIVENLYEVV